MKLLMGWVMSAGLVLTAATANAQMLAPHEIGRSPYTAVSDVGGPYAEAQEPRYVEPRYSEPRYDGPRYGVPRYDVPRYGPALLPPTEIYTIVRESGFSPLGIPQQRGFVYVISVIDRGGDDGRLVIDGRSGRIIRFMPAYRMGYNFNENVTASYGPAGPLPPISNMRGVPRPPASVPRVASRTPPVPLPKAPPPHTSEIKPEATPLAAKPVPEEPAKQSAAVQDKPTEAPPPRPAAVPIVEAKPAPAIKPTQEMPKAQGLD